MKRKDIICISTHYWNDFWFRKQHFMSRFAELGHRLLYVQPTFSMVRQNSKKQIAKNRYFIPFLEKLSRRIYLLSPPRLLPKQTQPLSSALSYRWFANIVGRKASKLGLKDPILWIYRPEYAAGIESIPHSTMIFDLADDLAAYITRPVYYKYINRCIDKLARRADLMVVTSPTLLDKYREKTRNCILIPNGFDEKIFDGAPKPIPSDLAKITRPIIGFVGVMFSFLDYDMIYHTALAIPEASFVFVGPVENGGLSGVERLKTLPNTYFLGRKPKYDISAYVSNFNICINPFKVDDVSRAVSPLKVYEYLACGKPVVSSPMEGLSREEAGKWVRFAEREHFAVALLEILSKINLSEKNIACIEAAKKFSWSYQFKKLRENIENL